MPYVYNEAGKDEAKRTFAIEALAEDIELLTAIREAGQEGVYQYSSRRACGPRHRRPAAG